MREFTNFGLLEGIVAGSPKLNGTAECRTLPTKVIDERFYGQDEQGNSLKGRKLRDATEAAKRTCSGCPVREGCLGHAMEKNIPYGIWGGKSHNERKAMKKTNK